MKLLNEWLLQIEWLFQICLLFFIGKTIPNTFFILSHFQHCHKLIPNSGSTPPWISSVTLGKSQGARVSSSVTWEEYSCHQYWWLNEIIKVICGSLHVRFKVNTVITLHGTIPRGACRAGFPMNAWNGWLMTFYSELKLSTSEKFHKSFLGFWHCVFQDLWAYQRFSILTCRSKRNDDAHFCKT
jgi:hypothetical protein